MVAVRIDQRERDSHPGATKVPHSDRSPLGDIMNTHRLRQSTFALAATLALLVSAPLTAQEDTAAAASRPVMQLIHIELKHGHDGPWRAAIKDFKACYEKAGGKRTWTAWRRLNGAGTVYTVVTSNANWAALDQRDEAMGGCYPAMMEATTPHEASVSEEFVRPNNDFSRPIDGDVVRVIGLMIDDYAGFMAAAGEINKTLKDADAGPHLLWMEVEGGPADAADMQIVMGYDNFAAMDVEVEGVWAVVERIHGKDKMLELRKAVQASVDDSWTYLYKRDGELSLQREEEG